MNEAYPWLMFGVAFGTLLLAVVKEIIDHRSAEGNKNENKKKIKDKDKEE